MNDIVVFWYIINTIYKSEKSLIDVEKDKL